MCHDYLVEMPSEITENSNIVVFNEVQVIACLPIGTKVFKLAAAGCNIPQM